MKLYTKNEKGNTVRTSLADALKQALEKSGYEMDNDYCKKENWQIVGIIQENKRSEQILVNIVFDGAGNEITDVKVYSNPIRRVVDEDNTTVII
jgi:hypothetical protein